MAAFVLGVTVLLDNLQHATACAGLLLCTPKHSSAMLAEPCPKEKCLSASYTHLPLQSMRLMVDTFVCCRASTVQMQPPFCPVLRASSASGGPGAPNRAPG